MKKLLLFLVLLSSVSYANFYKLTISRIDSDLYKTFDGQFLIKTSLCLELAVMEKVVLNYSTPYAFDNKLIFNNGRSCKVEEIYRL